MVVSVGCGMDAAGALPGVPLVVAIVLVCRGVLGESMCLAQAPRLLRKNATVRTKKEQERGVEVKRPWGLLSPPRSE